MLKLDPLLRTLIFLTLIFMGFCFVHSYYHRVLNTYPIVFMGSGDQSEVLSLIDQIDNAPPYSILTIKLAGMGGIVTQGWPIITALRQAHERHVYISFDVVGNIYSMHANLICFGDESKLEPGASVMFHSMSYTNILGQKVYPSPTTSPEAFEQQVEVATACVKHRILTQTEVVDAFINHKEIYIVATQDGKLERHTIPAQD